MKHVLLGVLMVLILIGSAFAEVRYEEYNPVYLNWGKPLRTMAIATIEQDGLYHIVFQAQTVNDGIYNGFTKQVMVAAKLGVNEEFIHGWTENVMGQQHYAMVTIVKVMRLYVGDVVTIGMRGDCSVPYPKQSVFVLTNPEMHKFQFDVVKIAD
jgi:hypothetical protein